MEKLSERSMARSLFDNDNVHFAHLETLIEIVPGGIVSKPLLDAGKCKQVLFSMDRGQQLTRHTSALLATIHVLGGRIRCVVAQKEHEMTGGDWLLLPPNTPHEVQAIEPSRFLLSLTWVED